MKYSAFCIATCVEVASKELIGSGSNWYQLGNKTCCIPKDSNFYVE